MMTEPPVDSFANRSSHCSRLVTSMDREKLLPTASGGPKLDESLPIRTLPPIGRDTCMTRPFSSSDTGMSGGPSPNVWKSANSPPKTDR